MTTASVDQTGIVTKVTGVITSPIGIPMKEGRNERHNKGKYKIYQLAEVNPT